MSSQPVIITAIMWNPYIPTFLEGAKLCPEVELTLYASKDLEQQSELLDRFLAQAARAEVILLYWSSEGFWDELGARLSALPPGKTIVTTSYDPANWGRAATTGTLESARVFRYMAEGGPENFRRLLLYLASLVRPDLPVLEPMPFPWQGLARPPERTVYETVAEYLAAYPFTQPQTVGLYFSRHSFTNTDMALEQALLEALEAQGLNVLPVFSHSNPDPEVGAWGPRNSSPLTLWTLRAELGWRPW